MIPGNLTEGAFRNCWENTEAAGLAGDPRELLGFAGIMPSKRRDVRPATPPSKRPERRRRPLPMPAAATEEEIDVFTLWSVTVAYICFGCGGRLRKGPLRGGFRYYRPAAADGCDCGTVHKYPDPDADA
jgi:hypothetical protein